MMGDRKARRLHKQGNKERKNAEEETRRVAKINKKKKLEEKKARSSSSKSAFINLTEREKGMRNGREGRGGQTGKNKRKKKREALILSYSNLSLKIGEEYTAMKNM